MSTPRDEDALYERYRLEQALDGELPAAVAEQLIAHAQDCPDCAAELERMRCIKALIRRSCRDAVAPRSLRERITIQYRSIEITSSDGSARVSMRSTRTVRPPQS